MPCQRRRRGRPPRPSDALLQRISFKVAAAEVEGILHLPEGRAAGGVAVLHDGGRDADQPEVVETCAALAAAGVGALRFRFREPATLDSALTDAAGAVRLLRAHPSLPNTVGIVGFGFGAAVAAVAAGRDSRLKAAALVDPPAQLGESRRPLAEVSRTRARVLVLSDSPDGERYATVLSQARVTNRLAGERDDRPRLIAEWLRESLT